MVVAMRSRRDYERPIRRLLGLSAEPPDPVPMRFTANGTVDFGTQDKRAVNFARWHSEGRRADIASHLSRVPYRARKAPERVRDEVLARVDNVRAARALSSAKTLRFTSPYVHVFGDCKEVEGWFDFGGAFGYSLTVFTNEAMVEYAEREWDRGELVTSDNSLVYGLGRWIVVPTVSLDDVIIREALERWYVDRFRWVRGHWSQREGTLPTINVDLTWETQEQMAARWTDGEHND
jgi:hypothetical protein